MSLTFRSRTKIFSRHPILARHVLDWQKEAFDLDEHRYEEGEKVWLDLDADEPETLTRETALKLNQETEAEFAALCDPMIADLPEIRRPELIIAERNAEDMAAFSAGIGEAFGSLSKKMNWDEIAILPMVRAPILSQDNDYPEASRAEQTLQSAGLLKDFSGAMCGDAAGVSRVLGPLFWIVRCNASGPYIVFNAKGSQSVGTLCQYANIHFDVYDDGEAERLKAALPDCGFEIAEDGICEERFSETGAIEGRRIDLG